MTASKGESTCHIRQDDSDDHGREPGHRHYDHSHGDRRSPRLALARERVNVNRNCRKDKDRHDQSDD